MAIAPSPIQTLTAQQISHVVITAAMKVHSELSAGLLESAYKTCLAFELRRAGLTCATEVPVPVAYSGIKLDAGYWLDLLVENLVAVEIKSVDAICPVHHAHLPQAQWQIPWTAYKLQCRPLEGWNRALRERHRLEVAPNLR